MNRFKTAVLLTSLTLLMVAMGSAIGGRGGMFFAFFMACAMNLFSYWFSDKIVLRMYDAREITETEKDRKMRATVAKAVDDLEQRDFHLCLIIF